MQKHKQKYLAISFSPIGLKIPFFHPLILFHFLLKYLQPIFFSFNICPIFLNWINLFLYSPHHNPVPYSQEHVKIRNPPYNFNLDDFWLESNPLQFIHLSQTTHLKVISPSFDVLVPSISKLCFHFFLIGVISNFLYLAFFLYKILTHLGIKEKKMSTQKYFIKEKREIKEKPKSS